MTCSKRRLRCHDPTALSLGMAAQAHPVAGIVWAGLVVWPSCIRTTGTAKALRGLFSYGTDAISGVAQNPIPLHGFQDRETGVGSEDAEGMGNARRLAKYSRRELGHTVPRLSTSAASDEGATDFPNRRSRFSMISEPFAVIAVGQCHAECR